MSAHTLPMLTRRASLQAAGALLASSFLGARAAETLADLRIVCGFPAGSATDTTSRRVAQQLEAQGYTKVATVDNRAGAGGQIAMQHVKTQAADGRTLLLTPMSMLGIYPHTYKKLAYDPVADFAPVSMACLFDFGVAAGPSVPASVKTVPELLRWCAAEPQRGTYGSPAAGAIPHFIGMLLGRAAKVSLTHVAYRGTPQMLQDVVGGQIPIGIGPLGDMLRYIGTPGYRVLATSGAKRSPFTPNIPTLVETGFSELAVTEWSGFFVPAGATAATVSRTRDALALAIGSPDTVKAFAASGLEAKASTPGELADVLAKDAERWSAIVKSFNFTMDS